MNTNGLGVLKTENGEAITKVTYSIEQGQTANTLKGIGLIPSPPGEPKLTFLLVSEIAFSTLDDLPQWVILETEDGLLYRLHPTLLGPNGLMIGAEGTLTTKQ